MFCFSITLHYTWPTFIIIITSSNNNLYFKIQLLYTYSLYHTALVIILWNDIGDVVNTLANVTLMTMVQEVVFVFE